MTDPEWLEMARNSDDIAEGLEEMATAYSGCDPTFQAAVTHLRKDAWYQRLLTVAMIGRAEGDCGTVFETLTVLKDIGFTGTDLHSGYVDMLIEGEE